MRSPLLLLQELGLWQFLGLQLVMGGVLLSALVHPLFVVAAIWALGSGELLVRPAPGLWHWLWAIGMVNLAVGVLAPALAAGFAVIRRGRAWLLPSVLLMPIYWLAISFAGYRAVIELVRRPFHWEKTRHGPARGSRGPAARLTAGGVHRKTPAETRKHLQRRKVT